MWSFASWYQFDVITFPEQKIYRRLLVQLKKDAIAD